MVCGDARLSDTGGTGWFSLMGSCKEWMCVGRASILLVCRGRGDVLDNAFANSQDLEISLPNRILMIGIESGFRKLKKKKK